MRLEIMGAGPHPDLSISGSIVTVAGYEVDCEARQEDSAVIIDLRLGEKGVTEKGGSYQIASIHIPPAEYDEIDEGTEEEQAVSLIKKPLDANAVLVTLWTI